MKKEKEGGTVACRPEGFTSGVITEVTTGTMGLGLVFCISTITLSLARWGQAYNSPNGVIEHGIKGSDTVLNVNKKTPVFPLIFLASLTTIHS